MELSASYPTANPSRIKLYGISVVQNEEDIIKENLEWASKFCDHIWVWDLGSTDNTWHLLQSCRSQQISISQRSNLKFGREVRMLLVKEIRDLLSAADLESTWIYRVDADEFLVRDPRPVIQLAEIEGAEMINGWHLDFCITPEDLLEIEAVGETEFNRIPIFDRYKYYQVKWREPKLFRLTPDLVLNLNRDYRRRLSHPDGTALKRSTHHVLIRHYRYRSPSQTVRRFSTRQLIRKTGYRGFFYDIEPDISHYVEPVYKCRKWVENGSTPRIRLIDVLNFKFYATKIKWMHHLNKLKKTILG